MDDLRQLIEEGIARKELPTELVMRMNRAPAAVAQCLAERFGRCGRREECQRVAWLLNETGPGGIAHLLEMLQYGPPESAASSVGLLSRLNCTSLEGPLLARVGGWNRAHHDLLVRQLALGGAPERGRLLGRLFSLLDEAVMPVAVDEMGLSGDRAAIGLLMRLAGGDVPQAADLYLRVKAMEALGRLRAEAAAPLLRNVVTSRQLFGWSHPGEMRVVAMQALARIDPQWTRDYMPQSRIHPRDLAMVPLQPLEHSPWARQRRYARVSLAKSVNLLAATPKGNVRLQTSVMSLGGGIVAGAPQLAPGMHSSVCVETGWRNVTADVLFREAPGQGTSFEIVEISLENRARLRRMLATMGAEAA